MAYVRIPLPRKHHHSLCLCSSLAICQIQNPFVLIFAPRWPTTSSRKSQCPGPGSLLLPLQSVSETPSATAATLSSLTRWSVLSKPYMLTQRNSGGESSVCAAGQSLKSPSPLTTNAFHVYVVAWGRAHAWELLPRMPPAPP